MKEEELFRKVFEDAAIGMSLLSIEPLGQYLDVNPAFCQMTGYSREELLSRDFQSITVSQDLEKNLEQVHALLDGTIPSLQIEKRYIRKDSSTFWTRLHISLVRDSKKKPLYLIVQIEDIDDHKQAEEALRESEERFRLTFKDNPIGMVLVGLDYKFLKVNEALCKMLGYTEQELTALTFVDITHPEDVEKDVQLAEQVFKEQIPSYELEKRYITKGGEILWINLTATVIRDQDSNVLYGLGMIENITERKRLEEQLRHAHKLEAIGQIAGGIAHEFNNLLTAIIGNLDLIKNKLTAESELLSLLNQSDQAAHRAATLTQQLLAFARRSEVNLQPQNLHSIAEDVVHLLRQTIDRRIQVFVESVDDLRPILADTDQMNQVIMNLCLNARDAITKRLQGMDPKDSRKWQPFIHVKTENVYADEAFYRFHPDAKPGDYISLCVCDNGCGIEKDIQHRIFEPFFTTKELGQGTGLGLATVYGIVKQHDGWIELDTKRKDATAFMAYLPCTDQSPVPKAQRTDREMPTKGTETILLVDDEPAIRRLGQTILEHHGYTVLLAEDGQEALEVFRREGKRIRLVILDLTMPRQSGQEVFLELRRLDQKIKVIVSSGHHKDLVLNELQNIKNVDFIPKPYRPNELARKVRSVLDQTEDL